MRIDNKATFVNSDDHKSKSDNNSSSQLLHRGIKIDLCVSVCPGATLGYRAIRTTS